MISFNKTPEGELWQEVIKLAMKDAGFQYDKNGGVRYVRPVLKASKKHQKDKKSLRAIHMDQGINFLTANSGAWRESREAICDMAMICPDQLRERCIQIMDRDYSTYSVGRR
ncbi:MAG: hypothetical protein O2942_09070 [Proteobacteria bacterium]|nr:hypothetical protein [Pseudomonadota bacterium]